MHHLAGLLFQPFEDDDLGLQFDDGAGGGGLIDDRFLELLVVFRGEVVGGVPDVFAGAVGEHAVGEHFAALAQLLFFDPALQLGSTTTQRLVNGLRAGGKPALQRSERETDRTAAGTVFELVGAVHLGLHVVGDGAVKRSLKIRETVIDRVGAALRKELAAVEAQHLFLDHATHEVRHIHLVRAVTEFAVEAIGVEQRQEELEILFLAVVRRRGHQQEVAGDAAEQFAELKALGLVDLVAEVVGRELVRFIDHHQIPARELQLL